MTSDLTPGEIAIRRILDRYGVCDVPTMLVEIERLTTERDAANARLSRLQDAAENAEEALKIGLETCWSRNDQDVIQQAITALREARQS